MKKSKLIREGWDIMFERVFVPIKMGVAEVVFNNPRPKLNMKIVSEIASGERDIDDLGDYGAPQVVPATVASVNIFLEHRATCVSLSGDELTALSTAINQYVHANKITFDASDIKIAYSDESF